MSEKLEASDPAPSSPTQSAHGRFQAETGFRPATAGDVLPVKDGDREETKHPQSLTTAAIAMGSIVTTIVLVVWAMVAQHQKTQQNLIAQDQKAQQDRERASILHDKGSNHLYKSEYLQAIVDFTETIRLNPNDDFAYAHRGWAFTMTEDFDRAIADCSEAIRINPKNALAYFYRGYAYAAKNDHDLAIADYSEVIRYSPQWSNAYYHRACSNKTRKDYDSAIADFTEVLRRNENRSDALLGRGSAYLAKKDYDKAMADYQKTIQVDENSADAFSDLAWIWATCPRADIRDGKLAVEYATKACQLTDWNDPLCLETLAAACAEIGDFEEACFWQRKCLEHPNRDDPQHGRERLRLKAYEQEKPWRDE